MRTLTFNRVIGSGAMGTVYHAELRVPRGFARTCAVKVMKTTGPDHEHFRGRMRDEARLLGMLADEQILGVSELVQVEGRDAVIMEYVEGVDLTELTRRREPVPPKALAELGAEVAGTVYRAHTATNPRTAEPLEVIHRDIKPANIMVTARGGVRVLDFGVARAAFDSRESQTQGLVLGTLNYFPPEILAGHDPSPAVDIYGLGLTIWECATGRDWGAPRVQKKQFERRVDRRLSELGGEYKPILPVLRQVLQWDPELRPDGGGMERMLLVAAEQCPGQGLRTWSREVVPQVLDQRREHQEADPLLGRTIRLDRHVGDPDAIPTDVGDISDVRAQAAAAPDASPYATWDDLGPPAAARRAYDEAEEATVAEADWATETTETTRPTFGLWAVVGVSILLLGVVLLLLVVVMLLLLILLW